jgi:predicted MFS family arabinose efflux permease
MKSILKLLTAFVTLTAVAGGILMILEPGGSRLHLSRYLLRNAPFHDFLLPGILLFLVVGGFSGVALVCQLSRKRNWYNWTLAAAAVLLAYIVIQILIIGEWNWLQLFYLFTGGFMALLTWQLKGKWAA